MGRRLDRIGLEWDRPYMRIDADDASYAKCVCCLYISLCLDADFLIKFTFKNTANHSNKRPASICIFVCLESLRLFDFFFASFQSFSGLVGQQQGAWHVNRLIDLGKKDRFSQVRK